MRSHGAHEEPGGALVEQDAWLRRLARGLTREVHEADDLTQEVFVAALRDEPHGRGPAMRAWLRTAAQRIAARARRGAQERAHRERTVARHELAEASPDSEAEARLDVQRRLLTAVEELDPATRTALVLRYLDGHPTREVARRLGVTSAAARQRISRGLARLRTRLAAELHERKDTLAAFVFLARRPVPASAGVGTFASGAPLLVPWSFMVKKPLALIASLALIGAGWVVIDPLLGEAEHGAHAQPVDGVAADEPRQTAATDATVHVQDPRAPAPAGTAAEAAPPLVEPRLRVVDSEGQPALGGHAAWVDRAGEVHELALAQDATAALPAESAGAHVFAAAPGLALASARFEETPVELVLTLPPMVSLRGRVTVNGAAPSAPILLTLEPGMQLLLTDGPWRSRAQAELAALGFLDPTIETRTDPGGQFEFTGLHPRGEGRVQLQGSYRVVDEHGTSIGYSLPRDEELLFDLEREPYLTGRVLWADSRKPVAGGLTAMKVARGVGTSSAWGGRVTADGHFEVPLPIAEDGHGLRHSRVTLEFHPRGARAVEHSFEYALEGVEHTLDVGTLLLERSPPLALRVLSASGAPVYRAHVLVPGESHSTDADGRVSLGAPQDDQLHVIAAEHALASVRVAELERAPDGTAVVHLTAGRTLRVALGACSVPPGQKTPRLVLAWEVNPFETLHAAGELGAADRARTKALFAFHGEALHGMGHRNDLTSGHIELEWQGAAPLVIPGLRSGARFVLGLRSALQDALVLEREVTVPTEAGIFDVTLASGSDELRGIELVALDLDGAPLAAASYSCKRPFDADWSSVRARAWPLPDGPLQFQARAPGYAAQTVDLAAGSTAPTLSIPLQPARQLVVRVQDEAGASLRPDRVTASAGSERTGRSSAGEVTTLTAVAPGPGEVEVTLGGRTWRAPFDAGAREVTVRVPRHGSVRVTLGRPPAISEGWGEWGLFAAGEAIDEPLASRRYTADAVGASSLERLLLPGAHVLEVRNRELHGSDRGWRVLRSVEVVIAAGEVSEIEL